eukprot:gnl/TRDRNA2_/TRDRNA2_185073_c0_seq1.p1 gnl/TRDRNA2_/TRDRNA2_185073_c0~~gnl/TRDRNA2_/TRDRNA2_185073_c0_seq1.p1  ORF type:complete len:625 (+),score=141.35 gnl/TRDRNA2_/TRDRNA2_185073_c0_seq1:74-1948(+)
MAATEESDMLAVKAESEGADWPVASPEETGHKFLQAELGEKDALISRQQADLVTVREEKRRLSLQVDALKKELETKKHPQEEASEPADAEKQVDATQSVEMKELKQQLADSKKETSRLSKAVIMALAKSPKGEDGDNPAELQVKLQTLAERVQSLEATVQQEKNRAAAAEAQARLQKERADGLEAQVANQKAYAKQIEESAKVSEARAVEQEARVKELEAKVEEQRVRAAEQDVIINKAASQATQFLIDQEALQASEQLKTVASDVQKREDGSGASLNGSTENAQIDCSAAADANIKIIVAEDKTSDKASVSTEEPSRKASASTDQQSQAKADEAKERNAEVQITKVQIIRSASCTSDFLVTSTPSLMPAGVMTPGSPLMPGAGRVSGFNSPAVPMPVIQAPVVRPPTIVHPVAVTSTTSSAVRTLSPGPPPPGRLSPSVPVIATPCAPLLGFASPGQPLLGSSVAPAPLLSPHAPLMSPHAPLMSPHSKASYVGSPPATASATDGYALTHSHSSHNFTEPRQLGRSSVTRPPRDSGGVVRMSSQLSIQPPRTAGRRSSPQPSRPSASSPTAKSSTRGVPARPSAVQPPRSPVSTAVHRSPVAQMKPANPVTWSPNHTAYRTAR